MRVESSIDSFDAAPRDAPRALQRGSSMFAFPVGKVGPDTPHNAAFLARRMLARRELRLKWFGPKLAQDATWNMLLMLVAKPDDRPVPIKCLWSVTGVSVSTALRIVHELELAGHVRCRVDAVDRRRQLVEIAPELRSRMSDYLSRSEAA